MTEQPATRTEIGPYPFALAELVEGCLLEPGWEVSLRDMKRDDDHGLGEARGLSLVFQTLCFDTYHPERGRSYSVRHIFPVPITTWNREAWQKWFFEQYVTILRHEAMEYFQVKNEDGVRERPYAPNHEPGYNPYV